MCFHCFFNPGGTDFNLVYNFWGNFFMLIHWISFLFGLKKIGGFAFYPPRAKVDHRGGRLKEAWTESKPGRFFPQLVMDPMDPSPHDSQLVMARQKWLQNAYQVWGWFRVSMTGAFIYRSTEWMNGWIGLWTVLFVLIEYCDSRHYSFSQFFPYIDHPWCQNWLGNSRQVELSHTEASIQL
jgi:hypothetical protein